MCRKTNYVVNNQQIFPPKVSKEVSTIKFLVFREQRIYGTAGRLDIGYLDVIDAMCSIFKRGTIF